MSNYEIILSENDLAFAKVRSDAIIPTKDEENAGRDVYANFEEDYMIIPPHTTKLIPTGIASALHSKYEIRLRDRGSNGSKGIHVNAGSIDSGYRGEWFVAWCNTTSEVVILSKLSDEELRKRFFVDEEGDTYIVTNPSKPDDCNNRTLVKYDFQKDFFYILYRFQKFPFQFLCLL